MQEIRLTPLDMGGYYGGLQPTEKKPASIGTWNKRRTGGAYGRRADWALVRRIRERFPQLTGTLLERIACLRQETDLQKLSESSIMAIIRNHTWTDPLYTYVPSGSPHPQTGVKRSEAFREAVRVGIRRRRQRLEAAREQTAR